MISSESERHHFLFHIQYLSYTRATSPCSLKPTVLRLTQKILIWLISWIRSEIILGVSFLRTSLDIPHVSKTLITNALNHDQWNWKQTAKKGTHSAIHTCLNRPLKLIKPLHLTHLYFIKWSVSKPIATVSDESTFHRVFFSPSSSFSFLCLVFLLLKAHTSVEMNLTSG